MWEKRKQFSQAHLESDRKIQMQLDFVRNFRIFFGRVCMLLRTFIYKRYVTWRTWHFFPLTFNIKKWIKIPNDLFITFEEICGLTFPTILSQSFTYFFMVKIVRTLNFLLNSFDRDFSSMTPEVIEKIKFEVFSVTVAYKIPVEIFLNVFL